MNFDDFIIYLKKKKKKEKKEAFLDVGLAKISQKAN